MDEQEEWTFTFVLGYEWPLPVEVIEEMREEEARE
jgi:hypothetical protein